MVVRERQECERQIQQSGQNYKGQQQRHPIFPDSTHTHAREVPDGGGRTLNRKSGVQTACGFIIERGHDSPANNVKLDRDHFLRSNAKIRDATRSSPILAAEVIAHNSSRISDSICGEC
jgi:hypothetical protein